MIQSTPDTKNLRNWEKKSLKAEVEEKCCSELGESLRRKNIKTKNRCHICDTIKYDQSEISISFTQPPPFDVPKKMPPPASASGFHRASAWNIHFGFPIDLKVEGFWCSFDVKWKSAFSTFSTQLWIVIEAHHKKNCSSKKC